AGIAGHFVLHDRDFDGKQRDSGARETSRPAWRPRRRVPVLPGYFHAGGRFPCRPACGLATDPAFRDCAEQESTLLVCLPLRGTSRIAYHIGADRDRDARISYARICQRAAVPGEYTRYGA